MQNRRCDIYNGVKELILSDEDLASFYSGNMKIDALCNQYLLIKNKDDAIVDKYKFDGNKFVKIKYKTLESQILSKTKARNIRQELFLDMLEADIPLKVVFGQAGSGKSYLATAWALQEIQKGKFEKLVIVRNNITVQDVPDIGALPGSETDKLRGYAMFVSDIISEFMFDTYIATGKIQLAYLGNMRGRSISNSIILCSEAQNLNLPMIKMVVSRVGENSTLILDGDFDQIDRKKFETENGLMALVESLKGNALVGVMELIDVERSAVARLASLIK